MKKSLFFSTFLIVFALSELCAFPPAIGTYRWRNDDGNETTATWKAAENDSILQKGEGNVRLRMEIATGGTDYAGSTGLYYKAAYDTIDTLFHLVSDNAAESFVYSLSPNVLEGEPTTEQLTNSNTQTNIAGAVKEVTGYFYFSITDGERKEMEFCIKPSPNTDFDNKQYAFVLMGEDTTGFFYYGDQSLPRIVLQKTTLTITANNASRETGQSNPSFTVSYSGFVDGDNESVLNTLPQTICSAGAESTAGQYDIVPYGAEDNKYNFEYATGKLTVTNPSGVDYNTGETLSLYPNPANEFVYIEGFVPVNAVANIFDLTGRLVLEQIVTDQVIDISSLGKGVYMLSINNAIFKITKE
jgi:hypothetical protein